MSTQLIITIILIFTSFFLLQAILNAQFFSNYYTEQAFNSIQTDLLEYIDNMDNPNSDLYDEMYKFTSTRNAYSVIVSKDFRILLSSYTDYTIVLKDAETDLLYTIIIPNNDYSYTLNETLSVNLYEYNENFYGPSTITTQNDNVIFSNNSLCSVEIGCISISGTVEEINKPNNLNYLFQENSIVNQEITKLTTTDLNDKAYEYGWWYKSTNGPVDTLVFIHEVRTWNYVVTIIPIEDTSTIINIISTYNYYVYLTAIVIIFLWSFRLSSIISKPIQNIELVTREIAELNFNVEAHEYNNRENTSLSKSINLIAKNLKNALETLNNKNDELTNLYEEQTQQVTLKKQLVSSISHELKTPLMIMQVTIQGIIDGIIPVEDQEKELLNVVEEINKSSVMIQDMLQIYRLDDANSELELSEFNFSNMVNFFIKDFESIIKQYELIVETNIKDNTLIEADQKLISRVISNFFTNAVKYTPEGQRISVVVEEIENSIYFELTNYGVTIKEEDLKSVWMPFFRGQRDNLEQRLKTKGTGIGLYLVSEILKAHNCEFGINNVINGVRVYFYISKTQQ
ncbi:MAG: HAMP domain-containing histidine kinase [Bacilli bacterium]|nr:HAMP domain-containing histidine kinase [Bacilli bacterium]